MKKNIFTILLIITSSVIQSQTVKKNTVYFSISSGLSRSEDGLAFLLKDSAKQWSPMINLGVGYRYNKNFGLELNGSTMITPISAEGVFVSNSGKVEIEAKHSNVILSPMVFLPFSNKSEIFLKVGCGILFSKSTIATSSNNDNEVFTDNFGYLIGLGFNKKVSENLVLSAQFDFSDSYGKKEAWTGDLGLLHIGIRYSINSLL
jgi:opacity protein-like surface antigen